MGSLFQLLFFAFIPLSLFAEGVSRSVQKKVFFVLYVMLALLVAVRFGVGIDTLNYMIVFDYIPKLKDLSLIDFFYFRFQPLYTLINSFCRTIFDDFLFLQIIHSILFYHSLYLLLKKFDLCKIYILFVIFTSIYFGPGMQMMREGFALSFCFYGLIFWMEGKLLLYLLFVLLGFGFHSGVVVFFLLPLLKLYANKYKYSSKAFVIFVALIMISFLFVDFFTSKLGAVGDASISRYKVSGDGYSFSFISGIRSLLLMFVLYKYVFLKKQVSPFVFYLGFMYVIIDFFAGSYMPILFRVATYFSVFYFILIKKVFDDKIDKYLKLFCVCLIFYQPITRGIYSLFTSTYSVPYMKYCSYYSSEKEKSYYVKLKNNLNAFDYFSN